MSIKKLAGQTMYYGLSNIVGRLINSLLSPLLTYLLGGDAKGLTDMGSFSLIYSFIAVANIIFTYGFETGYFRFINKPEISPTKVFRTTFGSLILTTIPLCLILILLEGPIFSALNLPTIGGLMIMISLIIGLDTICTIPFAHLRHEGRPKWYALVKISGIFTNLFLVLFFLYIVPNHLFKGESSGFWHWIINQNNVFLIVLANLIQNIVVFILLIPNIKAFKLKISPTLWKQIFKYSSPMVIIGLAGMINEVLDRIFLLYFLPMGKDLAIQQAGIYSANYKIAIFISLFIQAFRLGAEPFFFKQSSSDDAQKTYALVMKWFSITLCVAFLFSSLFLNIIVLVNKSEYRVGMHIIPIVLLANVFLGMYYNLSIWYKITDRMKWGIIITCIGAFITIIFNILLIPNYGISAPAWTTLICYVSMCIMAYILGQKYYPIPYPVRKILFYLGFSVLLFLVQKGLFILLENYINIYLYTFISAIILILLFLYFVIKLENVQVFKIINSVRTKIKK